MKPRAVSTAKGVALVRALEMQRPAAQRISADPYAGAFVNRLSVLAMRPLLSLGVLRALGVEPMMNFAMARERYIHDLIVAEAASGLEQLVILGAGFDTRAYRIPGIVAMSVFEVDHPVTQATKRAALRGVVEPGPNISFVGVDFDRDDLGPRLAAAGYRESAPTLFVWQGVTMYLTPTGIDQTLAFISGHSSPGSLLVFDYMEAAAVRQGAAATIRLFARLMGEPARFAIEGGQLGAFLEQRGFTAVSNIDAADLARICGTLSGPSRPIARGVAIASARVAPLKRFGGPDIAPMIWNAIEQRRT